LNSGLREHRLEILPARRCSHIWPERVPVVKITGRVGGVHRRQGWPDPAAVFQPCIVDGRHSMLGVTTAGATFDACDFLAARTLSPPSVKSTDSHSHKKRYWNPGWRYGNFVGRVSMRSLYRI
jgi:hypothetical protein